jgi:hypothetical protein
LEITPALLAAFAAGVHGGLEKESMGPHVVTSLLHLPKMARKPPGTPRPGGRFLPRLGAGKPPENSLANPFSGNKVPAT